MHYRYTEEDGKRHDWGLFELLEELSQSCPFKRGILPDTPSGVPTVEAQELEPITNLDTALLPATEPVLPDHTEIVITGDFNQLLDQMSDVLKQHDPKDQDVNWAIYQMAEPAILDFAIRTLVDDADLLTYWFPSFSDHAF